MPTGTSVKRATPLIIRAAERFIGLGLVGRFASTAHFGSHRDGRIFPMEFCMKKALLLLVVSLGLLAQDLPLNVQVKFLRIMMSSAGQYGVACLDATTKARLESVGLNVGPQFKLGVATSEEEVKTLKKAGKLVIVNNPAWLTAGAGVAITSVDGKPQITLNAANIKASGVTVSDTLIKMSNGNQ